MCLYVFLRVILLIIIVHMLIINASQLVNVIYDNEKKSNIKEVSDGCEQAMMMANTALRYNQQVGATIAIQYQVPTNALSGFEWGLGNAHFASASLPQ